LVGVCRTCIQTKSHLNNENSTPHPLREEQAVNPKTGRLEVVFVDLESVYPNYGDPMAQEFSFEELRARHRGWLDHDWAAIRSKEQEQAKQAAEASAAASQPQPESEPLARKPEPLAPKLEPLAPKSEPLAPKPEPLAPKPEPLVSKPEPLAPMSEPLALKTEPLAPKHDAQKPPKLQTVPLKGSVDDEMAADDENRPPSQANIDKAKAAKKARREERANRTRKIKVMDVKEIRGETQTGRTGSKS
jgi:checkpoint serine/threonine-protein kinase